MERRKTALLKPYYQDKWTTIYHGDCRKILPQLASVETVITDPIWPDTKIDLPGSKDPKGLFRKALRVLPPAERLIVHLGCDSDPRFLSAVPSSWHFLRVCNLDYIVPYYKGRLLYTGDIAYCFGVPPAYIPGRQLMTGGYRGTLLDKQTQRHTGRHRDKKPDQEPGADLPHPTPRDLSHVMWLVNQFSDNEVLDPFMGSGTTLVAAKRLGRKGIGIEIKKEYCDVAIERLRQSVMELKENDDRGVQPGRQGSLLRTEEE